MSKHVVTLVYRKVVGSMARKAVLVAMADRANDDGSDVWVSKTRMAAEIECSRQTVFYTIRELIEAGLVIETGKRPGKRKRGYTIIYKIVVRALRKLPDAWPDEDENDIEDDDDPALDSAKPVVSTSVTLPGKVVSKNGPSSVAVIGKNRPYRTIVRDSDFLAEQILGLRRDLALLEDGGLTAKYPDIAKVDVTARRERIKAQIAELVAQKEGAENAQ